MVEADWGWISWVVCWRCLIIGTFFPLILNVFVTSHTAFFGWLIRGFWFSWLLSGFWTWKLDHLERTQRTSQWMAQTWGTRVKGLKTGHMAIVIDFLESCRLGADFNDGSVTRCPTDSHRLWSSCLLNPRMWSLCSPETMEDLCVTIIAAYFFVWWWWSRIYQCDWRSDS